MRNEFKSNVRSKESYLVEGSSGTTSKKAIELDQESEVRILRLWGGTASLARVLVENVDTHDGR